MDFDNIAFCRKIYFSYIDCIHLTPCLLLIVLSSLIILVESLVRSIKFLSHRFNEKILIRSNA